MDSDPDNGTTDDADFGVYRGPGLCGGYLAFTWAFSMKRDDRDDVRWWEDGLGLLDLALMGGTTLVRRVA